MKRTFLALLLVVLAASSALPAHDSYERKDGYVPLLWDAAQGKLYFEIHDFNRDILYYTSIAKGSGSGSVGFEWAGGGSGSVIQFQRVGPKVLVVARNQGFRAGKAGEALEQSVEESFPESVLASLPVVKSEGSNVIVDAGPLLFRDAVGFALKGSSVRQILGPSGFGGGEASTQWRFDAARSAIYLPRTKAFPTNSEVEVLATYEAQSGAGARTAPDPQVLTGRLHHSFVQPPSGYQPRKADPRIGVNSLRFADYSNPYSQGTQVEWARRHRLEKKDPSAKLSEPKNPIVFYLDASVPEPIKSAMHDGALWWNKAFEAAGYKNALQIRDTPAGMDPMDARYNQIYWVNRDERGYSTGGGLTDPRTGEILAARVRLESDRVRTISRYWQSFMTNQTSTAAEDDDDDGAFFLPLLPTAVYSQPDSEQQLVLLRQALLTAHELGHSLGFAHNWNSSMNERASVMEYPSPRVKLTNGKIDLTDAYQKQIGAYDTMMVRYAYTDFKPAQEQAGLEAIIQDMHKQGLLYTPSSDPRWNRYDDLADPAEYLKETIAQRKVLLGNYGPNILKPGEPYGNLRGIRLWMVYLHHRWAIDSGVRYIGGMYHTYAVKGDSPKPTEIVPAAKQHQILGLLMQALTPENLAMPEKLLESLTVSPDEESQFRRVKQGPEQDNFELATGYAFDHLSAARTIAGIVIGQLLEPEKAARLVSFADRQQGALTLPELMDTLVKTTWDGGGQTGMNRSLQRQTQRILVDSMMMLGANAASTAEVKAIVMATADALRGKVSKMKDTDQVTEAHYRMVERDLSRFLQNPTTVPKRAVPAPPIMAPI